MTYYSHVLRFPNAHPFDDPETRWPSLIGPFVEPLIRDRPRIIYWFSYYTTYARFRIWTNEYEELRPHLEALRDELGLFDTGEEKNLMLEGDLASNRFIGPDSTSNRSRRAEKILRSLHATCELVIDSLRPNGDGSWSWEDNGDLQENPVGNRFFSVTHLFHNLTASRALVIAFGQPPNNHLSILSYYNFCNEVERGNLAAEPRQEFVVLL